MLGLSLQMLGLPGGGVGWGVNFDLHQSFTPCSLYFCHCNGNLPLKANGRFNCSMAERKASGGETTDGGGNWPSLRTLGARGLQGGQFSPCTTKDPSACSNNNLILPLKSTGMKKDMPSKDEQQYEDEFKCHYRLSKWMRMYFTSEKETPSKYDSHCFCTPLVETTLHFQAIALCT